MKRFNINAAAGLILLTGLTAGCGHKSESANQVRNVILATVTSMAGEESADYPGVVEEGASVNASFMADGKIAAIMVKEGDRVRKGQLLARLDDSDYLIGLSQLETQLNQMTREKERMDAMYEKHNIAPNDYEKFEAGYKQLTLQLEMAKRQLDYTRLYSPADGYVATKYLNPGELTGAGTPVANIIDDSRLHATVDLPVSVYLKRDDIVSAKGSVPGVAGMFPLSIVSFTPEADNNMLYRMKLSIPSSVARDMTAGMNISVTLSFTEGKEAESLVPSRALFKDGENVCVWVFNPQDSTIRRHKVTVEGAPLGKMSVVKGLEAGESIVETGVKQLYDGEKVNVLSRKDAGLAPSE